MASILVVGAGAVGGYFGARLMAAGHDVRFVARGRTLEALRQRGLSITGAMGELVLPEVEVSSDPGPPRDLALVCVKTYDLEGALPLARGRTVLTLENGVDAPFRARELAGDVVLGGSTGIVADAPEPGHVHCVSSYAWIRFGELDGSGTTERVRRVEEWLSVDGIEPIPVPDASVALWEKMALMCAMAGLTTLEGKTVGDILGEEDTRRRFRAIVAECEAVARAAGVRLDWDFTEERLRYAHRIDPAATSSMSRDLLRGRPIELETFNGTIVRMGAELGVDVPENRSVYEGIRALL